MLESPTKIELKKVKGQVTGLRRKLKVSRQKARRLKKTVISLKGVLKELKQQHLISDNCEEMLQRSFSRVPLSLLKRLQSGSGRGSKYSPELKSFAVTLQFYSSKAYEFVRKTFKLALPHQTQIRKWYGKIPADPGFSKPAFQALAAKVEALKERKQPVICSLMLDEMAIRKHISWDGNRFRGYVNLGNGVEDDDLTPIAKDALVLMAKSFECKCG